MMDDRTGNQVRKEGDEQQEIAQVVLADDAPADIHEISDLREGKKGYAQRKHDLAQDPVGAEHPVDIVDEEIGVFEIAQQQQIHRDAPKQRASRPPTQPYTPADLASHPVIEHHGCQDQAHIDRAPPAIEEERRQNQPEFGRFRTLIPRQETESDQGYWQEEKEEDIRTKQH